MPGTQTAQADVPAGSAAGAGGATGPTGAQRRGGVRPARAPRGRRAAGAVALVAVCAAFPLFVNDAIGYVPLGACLSMIALSAAYLALASRALDCVRASRGLTCVRGQSGAVAVRLANRSRLALVRVEPRFSVALEGGQAVSVQAKAALAPREEHAFTLDASFDHVGDYRVGLDSVEVFDLVGLFSHVVEVGQRCEVRVTPRRVALGRPGGEELSATDTSRGVAVRSLEASDYASVREYRLGDAMKTVHWKMSGRFDDKLFTKLFEAHADPGCAMLLDFSCGPEVAAGGEEVLAGLYDTMLEAAFSLVEAGQRAGMAMAVAFFDRAGALRVERACAPDDLDALVEAMPRLGPQVDPRLAARLVQAVSCSPEMPANVALFTADLAQEKVEALVRCRCEGRGARAVLAVPPTLAVPERAARLAGVDRLAAAGVPTCVVGEAADLAKGVSAR